MKTTPRCRQPRHQEQPVGPESLPVGRWRHGRGASWLRHLSLGLCLCCHGGPTCVSAAPAEMLQIVFSTGIMTEINENDAKAAIKTWAHLVLGESGITREVQAQILNPTSLKNAFLNNQVDVVTLTTREFLELGETVDIREVILGMNQGELGEEYLLLVPAESTMRNLVDLRGRRLELLQHHSTSLAMEWLEVLLAREHMPAPEAFFGRISRKAKPSAAVLPVFFQTADACLVTRRGFNTMVELNPQVGRKLRPIAASPRLAGTLFCFNPKLSSDIKDPLLAAIQQLPRSPAGRQILTVFQTEELLLRPAEQLRNERELLAGYTSLHQSDQRAGIPLTQSPAAEADDLRTAPHEKGAVPTASRTSRP